MNGNVVLMSYKIKMESSNKMIITDVSKVRDVKKALVQLLMSKKSLMEPNERMEFLDIDAKLYSWLNSQNGDITNTILDAMKILRSYNRSIAI